MEHSKSMDEAAMRATFFDLALSWYGPSPETLETAICDPVQSCANIRGSFHFFDNGVWPCEGTPG
jgi:hypothetical protein